MLRRLRRRQGLWVAFGAGVLVHAAAVAVIARRQHATVPEPVRVATPASPTAGPAVPDAPATGLVLPERSVCPAPVRTTPAGELGQPDEPVMWITAAPTDARWIAAWNADHVFASSDGGAHFQRVLDGDGRVLDAAFDCHGRLYVQREGDRIAVRDGVVEGENPIDGFAGAVELIGGGPMIAAYGIADDDDMVERAAFSGDGGATWAYRDHRVGSSSSPRVAMLPDGTLRTTLVWSVGDGHGIDIRWISAGGGPVRHQDLDVGANAVAFAGDRLYANTDACGRPDGGGWQLCTWTAEDDLWQRVTGVDGEDARLELIELVGGSVGFALVGGRAWRLDGARAARSVEWPGTIRGNVVDAAGRLWGISIDTDRLVRTDGESHRR